MKPFSKWTKEEIEDEFNLTAVYAESLAYDATKEADIEQRATILRKTKEVIDELVCSRTQTAQSVKNFHPSPSGRGNKT